MASGYRKWAWLLVAAAVLLAVRLALPYAVRHSLNQRMDRMGDYHGHIADVDLHLWRGAYTLRDLRIDKVEDKLPVPFFSAGTVGIALSWHALLRGRLRGTVALDRAQLHFVDGNATGHGQAGRGVDWRQRLQDLVPMRIDQLRVRRGQVTFHNYRSRPEVNLEVTGIEGSATNLTNVDRRQGRRVADVQATALVLGDAPLQARASFDPLAERGDFSFELQIRRIRLARLNDVARAYAHLDFAAGNGDFVMQLKARDGQLDGYAKPLLHHVQVFSWKQDVEQGHDNPLQVAWEAVAGAVGSLFKNHARDQFATRIPISGRIDDKDLGTWEAVVGVLRNAFVKAYTPRLEDLRPAPEATR